MKEYKTLGRYKGDLIIKHNDIWYTVDDGNGNEIMIPFFYKYTWEPPPTLDFSETESGIYIILF